MITIVLFDDDARSIATLHTRVEQRFPTNEPYTILEATTLDELEALLADGTQVDIFITDIIMPAGQPSGIRVVQQLFPPESGTQVIYVSGYLDQAPEVYQTSHIYFLLKPIDPGKLQDALEKALLALTTGAPLMLRVKSGHKEHLINAATILYLESNLHKVIVHCRSQRLETYARLDDLQDQLPPGFSRCHRSYVVNLAFVSSLKETEVRLHDGTKLPVSRRRALQTQRDLLAYLSEQSRTRL